MSTDKRTPNFALVIFLLFVSAVSGGCASNELKDVKLTMAWAPGERTRHTHLFTMDSLILGNKLGWIYEGAFTREVTMHEEGLLISHSDFKLLRAEQVTATGLPEKKRQNSKVRNNRSAIEASGGQKLIAKLSVAGIVIRPDYIISPSGEFIRFHEYNKFKTENLKRVAKFVGLESEAYLEFYAPVIEALTDQGAQQEAVKADINLWSKWNAMGLSLGNTEAGKIGMLVSSKKGGVKHLDGQFGYMGSAKCNWETEVGCVSLKFNSEKSKLYDVHMVVEPDSLTPHSYLITSHVVEDLSKQEGFDKNKKLLEQFQNDKADPKARMDLSYKIDIKRISK